MRTLFTAIFSLIACALFAQMQTFNYTGGMQTFTVPANCFSITVDVMGAQGGDATNLSQQPSIGHGGMGGRVQATIAVNPGDVLNIFVGGMGASDGLTLTCNNSTGGYNGGGDGKGGYNSYNYNAGGGGGASDIRLNGTALSDRIFVAGGGGGGCCSGCTGAGTDGGHGGGLIGQDGQNSTCFLNLNNGKGGTQTAGGLPGAWAGACTNSDTGSLGMGGRGQDSASCSGGVTCGSGGGGGAGYYGGGGGGNGPGGGGSNYASPSATGVIHTQGYRSGDGQVIISYLLTSASDHVVNSASLSIYPNPAGNEVSVKIEGKFSQGELVLTNMLGEAVYSGTLRDPVTLVDLNRLDPGIYFVKVKIDGVVAVKKLVKR
jgi:hypothetical protein